MRLERRLRGKGGTPSFDYTAWICDDVGGQGEADRSTGLQIATDETVAQLLHEKYDWDATAVVEALLSGDVGVPEIGPMTAQSRCHT
jgi:hypothetical protein